jgi:hypothetical protein
MYHYDPTTGGIPPGFPSAINLSVKCVAAAQAQAQVQAQAQMKSSEPTSPGGSVMDLSTSSVTSTSPQVRLSCSASAHLCYRSPSSTCSCCLYGVCTEWVECDAERSTQQLFLRILKLCCTKINCEYQSINVSAVCGLS